MSRTGGNLYNRLEVVDLAFVFVFLFEFVLQGYGVFFRAVVGMGLGGFWRFQAALDAV